MAERRDRTTGDEGFLGRWSRLKTEARADDPARPPPDESDRRPDRPEDRPDDRPAEVRPEDLPDIDSLTSASDFKVFMQKGVPEELKTLALRKLWRLKPSLANLDGLLEYGGDFRTPKMTAGAVKTAYQVGRGFLDRADPAKAPPETAPEVADDQAGPADALEPPDDENKTVSTDVEPAASAPEPAARAAAAPENANDPASPLRRRPLPRPG